MQKEINCSSKNLCKVAKFHVQWEYNDIHFGIYFKNYKVPELIFI